VNQDDDPRRAFFRDPPTLQGEPVAALEAYLLEVEVLVGRGLLDGLADGGGEPVRYEQSNDQVPQSQNHQRKQAPAECVLHALRISSHAAFSRSIVKPHSGHARGYGCSTSGLPGR
jgi:hypothetical protein